MKIYRSTAALTANYVLLFVSVFQEWRTWMPPFHPPPDGSDGGTYVPLIPVILLIFLGLQGLTLWGEDR